MVMVKLLHKQSLLQYSEPSLKITGGKCPPCAILRGPAVGKEGEPAAPCPSSSRYKTVPPRWSGGQLVHRPPTWFCSVLPSIFRDRPQEPLTVLHICFEKRRPSWKTMGPVLNAVQTINWCKKPWRKKLVSQMRFFVPSLTSLKEGGVVFDG